METSLFSYDLMFQGDCKDLPAPKEVYLTDPLRLVGMFLYAKNILHKSYDQEHTIEVMDRIWNLESWIKQAEECLPRWTTSFFPFFPAR